MHRVHAFDQEQTEVHQVTVAPAAVTLEFIQQVRRQFFVAARQVVSDPHAPTGTAHQRGFNEIVGQNRPRKRALARQRRQGAVLDKRLHADDRVVAPVMGFTQLPEVQTGGEQRAVYARCKLLHACIQGVHARRPWRGLDNACVWRGFHQAHQAGQAFAAHDAVGVEHHHVLVITAPTTAEVVEVAALTLHTTATTAIENPPEAFCLAAHIQPGLLFCDTNIGVVTVAQDKEVKAVQVACGSHRFKRCPQARKHTGDVFVTDRHHQRCTRLLRDRLIASAGARNAVLVMPGQQFKEAHQGGPEARRHPAKQNSEEDQDAGLQGVRQHLLCGLQQRLVEYFFEVNK